MSIKNLNELKARINIVDIVKSYVPLKNQHGSYKGLCPFHSEKTPSFSVSEAKQMFHCFGCKESGDAISFIQKFKHYDFNEAVREIADIYNFELEFSGEKSTPKKDYFEFYARCNAFFKENLLKHDKLLAYLARRGLNKDDLDYFDIGLVPDNYKLVEFIGTDKELALQTGLLIKGQNGLYSQLAKRLSFALKNPIFKIVGFACRLHDYENFSHNPAKYINSRESFLFHKSNFLYNLNFAKPAYFKRTDTAKVQVENKQSETSENGQGEVFLSENRELADTSKGADLSSVTAASGKTRDFSHLAGCEAKKDEPQKRLIIVEGYMDSIALSKFGLKANVAACGTAFNQIHLATLLKQGIDNFALCFDKDEAGLKATLKTCELLFKHGFFEAEIWRLNGDFKDIGEVLEKRAKTQQDVIASEQDGRDNLVNSMDCHEPNGSRNDELDTLFEKINAFEFYVRENLAAKDTAREKDKFLNACLRSIKSKNNYFLKDFCLEILEKITGKEFKDAFKVSVQKVSFESEKAVFKSVLCDKNAALIARELMNSAFFGEYESSFKHFVETGELDEKAQILKDDESVSVLNALDFDDAVKSLKKAFLQSELEKAKIARNFTLIVELQKQIQKLDEIAEVF